jgi:hypothetical protein
MNYFFELQVAVKMKNRIKVFILNLLYYKGE